jgi:hypothetical protein
MWWPFRQRKKKVDVKEIKTPLPIEAIQVSQVNEDEPWGKFPTSNHISTYRTVPPRTYRRANTDPVMIRSEPVDEGSDLLTNIIIAEVIESAMESSTPSHHESSYSGHGGDYGGGGSTSSWDSGSSSSSDSGSCGGSDGGGGCGGGE